MAIRATSKRKSKAVVALAEGLHAASVDLVANDEIRLRLPGGERLTALLDDGVERELVEECMRKRRRVIVCNSPRGPLVIGALQTARVFARDERGNLTLEAKDLRIVAERLLTLEAGESALRLERAGVLKAEGQRMTIDMASLLRVFAHRVDLP